MLAKILPITTPAITTATGYADILAILSSYEESFDWMYSHYIQMFAIQTMPADPTKEYWPLTGYCESFFCDFDYRRIGNTLSDGHIFNRELCPFLNVFELPMSLISQYDSSYISFIKKCIDMSIYVYSIVDVSKVSAYPRNDTHPMLVYGYDDKTQTIHFGDFMQNNVYQFAQSPYSEIEAAFQNAINTEFPLVKSVALIQYVANGAFTFSFDYIRESISEYLMPNKKTAENFSNYATSYFKPLNWRGIAHLGINYYNFLSEYFNIEMTLGMYPTDIIPFHALFDHKEMMVRRLEYLLQKGCLENEKKVLIEDYKEVRDSTLKLRNLVMKYNLKQSEQIAESIHNAIADIYSRESVLLKSIFDL
jgi:hypothetical protein